MSVGAPWRLPLSDMEAVIMHRSEVTSLMVSELHPRKSEMPQWQTMRQQSAHAQARCAQRHKNSMIKSVPCSARPLRNSSDPSLPEDLA